MKGFTTDKQLGKRDGRRYYQQKGVEGIVSASINQGMSSRVKNDAAYANTRLNNAEFGAAGSTAGAITRSLSQKWRYLLVPFAAGKLAKDVRAQMMLDEDHPWGQRSLIGNVWQKVLADKVSQLSKNPVSDFGDLRVISRFDAQTGMSISTTTPALHNEVLESKGADGVDIVFIGGVVNCAEFDTSLNGYEPASQDMVVLAKENFEFGEEVDSTLKRADIKLTAQANNELYGGMAVFLPYKNVSGEKHILQELCSFQMVAAEPAA